MTGKARNLCSSFSYPFPISPKEVIDRLIASCGSFSLMVCNRRTNLFYKAIKRLKTDFATGFLSLNQS